jgi:flagellar basal body-associated protein FliL
MGICDSFQTKTVNRKEEKISNEIQQPFSRKEIKEFESNKLKKGICLYIKKDINSIISYYFYINNIFIIFKSI